VKGAKGGKGKGKGKSGSLGKGKGKAAEAAFQQYVADYPKPVGTRSPVTPTLNLAATAARDTAAAVDISEDEEMLSVADDFSVGEPPAAASPQDAQQKLRKLATMWTGAAPGHIQQLREELETIASQAIQGPIWSPLHARTMLSKAQSKMTQKQSVFQKAEKWVSDAEWKLDKARVFLAEAQERYDAALQQVQQLTDVISENTAPTSVDAAALPRVAPAASRSLAADGTLVVDSKGFSGLMVQIAGLKNLLHDDAFEAIRVQASALTEDLALHVDITDVKAESLVPKVRTRESAESPKASEDLEPPGKMPKVAVAAVVAPPLAKQLG
jgi:hypothetical protein